MAEAAAKKQQSAQFSAHWGGRGVLLSISWRASARSCGFKSAEDNRPAVHVTLRLCGRGHRNQGGGRSHSGRARLGARVLRAVGQPVHRRRRADLRPLPPLLRQRAAKLRRWGVPRGLWDALGWQSPHVSQCGGAAEDVQVLQQAPLRGAAALGTQPDHPQPQAGTGSAAARPLWEQCHSRCCGAHPAEGCAGRVPKRRQCPPFQLHKCIRGELLRRQASERAAFRDRPDLLPLLTAVQWEACGH